MYVIGKTGTGKTTLLETLIRQDIQNGDGLAVFDPHGDLAMRALTAVPESRKRDVVYLDLADRAHPFAFNPLENIPVKRRPLAASGLLEVFKKLWADSWDQGWSTSSGMRSIRCLIRRRRRYPTY